MTLDSESFKAKIKKTKQKLFFRSYLYLKNTADMPNHNLFFLVYWLEDKNEKGIHLTTSFSWLIIHFFRI